MKIIFLLLLVPALALAQDIRGVGSGPLPLKNLGNDISFSVILKPESNSLHWKIAKGTDSIVSGERIHPSEKYFYCWDPKTEILWFATRKTIMDISLKDWGFTKALYRPSEGYAGYSDLPEMIKNHLPEILKK